MLIPDGWAQANLKFTGSPVPTGAEVTFGVALELFSGSPADAAEVLGDLWAATLGDFQGSTCVLSTCLVKFGPNATGPSAEVGLSHAGGNLGAITQPQVSVLVRKNTALGGRQGQGRFFVPGYTEGNIDQSGIINNTDLASLQTAADDFFDGLVTAELPMVVLSAEGSPIASPRLVTSLTVDAKVATQRRRNRR